MIGYAHAIRIDFPGHDFRFVTAGEYLYDYGSGPEVHQPVDPEYGQIIEVSSFASGVADDSPSGELVFALPSAAAANALTRPEVQRSPIWCYEWEIDLSTGAVLNADQMFKGRVDYAFKRTTNDRVTVRMGFSTKIENFFNVDKGNTLNRQFHRSIHPEEAGLDNTTGVGYPVPWGIEGVPKSSSGGGSPGNPNPRPGYDTQIY